MKWITIRERHFADRRGSRFSSVAVQPGRGQPARIERDGAGAAGRVLGAAAAGVRRAGLHDLGRLHGPRQLGDRHRRRVEVRLHAAVCRAGVQHVGGAVAGFGRPAGHRHRAGPGAGVPRQLPAPGRDRIMAGVRAGDHRLRLGGGDRHRHRAQPAVRDAVGAGGAGDGTGRLPAAAADAARVPVPGGVHRRAASIDCRVLRGADRAGVAAGCGGAGRLHPADGGADQPGYAIRGHRHPGSDGDAPQPVPAQLHRADPRLSSYGGRAAAGGPLGDGGQHGGAHPGAVRARGHLGRRPGGPGRGGPPPPPPTTRSRRSATRTSCCRRCWAPASPPPCSRWRCWRRG